MNHQEWCDFFSRPGIVTRAGTWRRHVDEFREEWDTLVDAARECYPECVLVIRFVHRPYYKGNGWHIKVLEINEP